MPSGRQSASPEARRCRGEQREIAYCHVDIFPLELRGVGSGHLLHNEGGHRPARAQIWVGHRWPAERGGLFDNANPDTCREGGLACGRILAASAPLPTLQFSNDLFDCGVSILLDRVVRFVLAPMPFTGIKCLIDPVK